LVSNPVAYLRVPKLKSHSEDRLGFSLFSSLPWGRGKIFSLVKSIQTASRINSISFSSAMGGFLLRGAAAVV